MQVKLLPQDGELYVFAQSRDRVAKERAMRRRQLKRLWARLKQLSTMQLTREELLMKLGAARDQSRSALAPGRDRGRRRQRHVQLSARSRQAAAEPARAKAAICCAPISPRKTRPSCGATICCWLRSRRRSRTSKAISPSGRSFTSSRRASRRTSSLPSLAYCLHVTLARRLHALAPGLTPRSVLEKFAAVQMIDVHIPTTDGRELVLTRYTEPEESQAAAGKLKLVLPDQPPPKITAPEPIA